MDTPQKIDIAFKATSLAMGVAVTIMFGSQISEISRLLDSVERVMSATERLIDLGPEAIADVGIGIEGGVVSAGEGLATAGENIIGRVRGAISK